MAAKDARATYSPTRRHANRCAKRRTYSLEPVRKSSFGLNPSRSVSFVLFDKKAAIYLGRAGHLLTASSRRHLIECRVTSCSTPCKKWRRKTSVFIEMTSKDGLAWCKFLKIHISLLFMNWPALVEFCVESADKTRKFLSWYVALRFINGFYGFNCLWMKFVIKRRKRIGQDTTLLYYGSLRQASLKSKCQCRKEDVW